jgi:hypothetical protein
MLKSNCILKPKTFLCTAYGHDVSRAKTGSVFERYIIIKDIDLRLAFQKQKFSLNSQEKNVAGTVHDFKKEGASPATRDQPLFIPV